jgi:hypothetical protein
LAISAGRLVTTELVFYDYIENRMFWNKEDMQVRPGREQMLGQSALDRFCHRAHQFVIEGDSYRKRTAPGATAPPKTGGKATT